MAIDGVIAPLAAVSTGARVICVEEVKFEHRQNSLNGRRGPFCVFRAQLPFRYGELRKVTLMNPRYDLTVVWDGCRGVLPANIVR